MKVAVSLVLVLALVFSVVAPGYAEPPHQVMQGTEIHLTLLTPVSSSHSREGDPFVVVLAQPIAIDSRIVLPVGTRVHGVIGTIEKPKMFSVFRGQAYMSLTFKSIEVDSRLIPAQMSILALGRPRVDSYSKPRNDMKITEGEVIKAKHDYRGDVLGATIGSGAGSLAGVIFGNAARGFGIGLAAGAVYVVARKGKEIDLPANSGMLVRLDSTVTLPVIAASTIPADPAVATASR